MVWKITFTTLGSTPLNVTHVRTSVMGATPMKENRNTAVILLRQCLVRRPLRCNRKKYLQIKANKDENFRICLLRDCIV